MSSVLTRNRSGVINCPQNAKLHYNYGNVLRDSGRTAKAIAHYREAVR